MVAKQYKQLLKILKSWVITLYINCLPQQITACPKRERELLSLGQEKTNFRLLNIQNQSLMRKTGLISGKQLAILKKWMREKPQIITGRKQKKIMDKEIR